MESPGSWGRLRVRCGGSMGMHGRLHLVQAGLAWASQQRFWDVFAEPGGLMRTTLLAAALISFASLLPANRIVRAQGTGTSGEIRGTVTDPTGGTVPKATVTVEDAEKGIRRTAATETDGAFRVTGLPPASYSVTVETSGFQKEIRKDVVVNV